MKGSYRFGLCSLWALVLVSLAGCGDAGRVSETLVAKTKTIDKPATVALPAILLEPAADAKPSQGTPRDVSRGDWCAPLLNVSLYVQGPDVKGALVETLAQAGCEEQRPHPRFYEFRRSLFTCGRMTHVGALAGTPNAKLTLIDRSGSYCDDDAGLSELEVIETLPSGQKIRATGSF